MASINQGQPRLPRTLAKNPHLPDSAVSTRSSTRSHGHGTTTNRSAAKLSPLNTAEGSPAAARAAEPISPISHRTADSSILSAGAAQRRTTSRSHAANSNNKDYIDMERSSVASDNMSHRAVPTGPTGTNKRQFSSGFGRPLYTSTRKVHASYSEETLQDDELGAVTATRHYRARDPDQYFSEDEQQTREDNGFPHIIPPLGGGRAPQRSFTASSAPSRRAFDEPEPAGRRSSFLGRPSTADYPVVKREPRMMSSVMDRRTSSAFGSLGRKSPGAASYVNEDYEVVRQNFLSPYAELKNGNNSIFDESAMPPTPSMLILQRMKGWKNIIHLLHVGFKEQTAVEKQYAITTARNAHSWISSSSLDRDLAFGSEDSSLTRFLDCVKDYSKDMGREHDEIYRVLSTETVPMLASSERDVDNKISTLQAQLRRREEVLRKDSLRLFQLQNDLTRSLAAHHGTNASVSVIQIGDPWVKNITLKKHLRAYINRFEAAHQSEDSLDVNFEIWEKNFVENLKTALTHYTTITSIGTAAESTTMLRESLSILDAEEEWDHFYARLEKSRTPDGPEIEYPGWDDPYCTAVREGPVLRKSKYLKSWNKIWWVVTSAGWLHEFKERPNLSGIDMIKPKRSFWLRGVTLTPLGGLTNGSAQEFHLFERSDMGSGKSTKTKVHKYMTDSVAESESWFGILSHFVAGTLGFSSSYDYAERTAFRSPKSFAADIELVRERQRSRRVALRDGKPVTEDDDTQRRLYGAHPPDQRRITSRRSGSALSSTAYQGDAEYYDDNAAAGVERDEEIGGYEDESADEMNNELVINTDVKKPMTNTTDLNKEDAALYADDKEAVEDLSFAERESSGFDVDEDGNEILDVDADDVSEPDIVVDATENDVPQDEEGFTSNADTATIIPKGDRGVDVKTGSSDARPKEYTVKRKQVAGPKKVYSARKISPRLSKATSNVDSAAPAAEAGFEKGTIPAA